MAVLFIYLFIYSRTFIPPYPCIPQGSGQRTTNLNTKYTIKHQCQQPYKRSLYPVKSPPKQSYGHRAFLSLGFPILSHTPSQTYFFVVLAHVRIDFRECAHRVEFIHVHTGLLSEVSIHVLVADSWHLADIRIVPGRGIREFGECLASGNHLDAKPTKMNTMSLWNVNPSPLPRTSETSPETAIYICIRKPN